MIRYDGEGVITEGRLRVVKLIEGWFVLGQGYMIPVRDKETGKEIIKDLEEKGSL